uniref:Uncharacterized protein n=1 Tax=Acrobeloides nanus TaxID=290746 RepID=A0A914C3L3_9BILA
MMNIDKAWSFFVEPLENKNRSSIGSNSSINEFSFIEPEKGPDLDPNLPFPAQWDNLLKAKLSIPLSERIWLEQLSELGLENLEFVENPQAKPLSKVKFEFPLHIATFDLEVTHSENFPFEEPEIECSFKEAFQYKWTNEDSTAYDSNSGSLKHLYDEYADFAAKMDLVLAEISNLNTPEFEILKEDGKIIDDLVKIPLDEDNPKLLVVSLGIRPEYAGKFIGLQLKFWIDSTNPKEYPEKVISHPLNFEVMNMLDPEKWDAEKSLYENVMNIFGDLFFNKNQADSLDFDG